MADVTLTDISEAFGFNSSNSRSTESYFGTVLEIIPVTREDSEETTYYYSVLIDGNNTPTECARLVNAGINDRVLVSVLQNGHSVVTSRIDGDLNANDAKEIADNAIVEDVIHYLATSLDSGITIDTPGWTTTIQSIDSENRYLWTYHTQTKGSGDIEDTSPIITGVYGDPGDPGATGPQGEDATVLRIDSSRGVAFKNSEVSTVLSVVIYFGSEIITDITALHASYGNGAYLEWKWQGYDSDTWHTISSTDTRLGNDGFTLTLSPTDVDIKAVFSCNLIL